MELVVSDLVEAKRVMTVYDRDEDGAIDQEEQQRLRWKEQEYIESSELFDAPKAGQLPKAVMGRSGSGQSNRAR